MSFQRPRGARPLGDFATSILDPVLKRKAGLSTALIQSWDEVVGQRLSAQCRPERIAWPRRSGDDEPFEPATLVVACTGPAALHLQHETGEIINRINAFLGFAAIGRLRIVQKPVVNFAAPKPVPPRPTELQKQRVAGIVRAIEDDDLRASLERLGGSVAASRAARSPGKERK